MRQDRIDRTIPYKNIIMRCDRFIAPVNAAKLPQGFVCRMYRPGMERAWAELEHEIGDFACEQDALLYFQGSYMQDVDALQGRCIFVEEINSGAVIGLLHGMGIHVAASEPARCIGW